jgi:imidazolonepropionase
MDIHATGGGIHYTVECVQQATPTQLYDTLKSRLQAMLSCGTTTLEAKSGYGLTLDAELKMLRVLEQAKKDMSLTISSTYCGAHAVPR